MKNDFNTAIYKAWCSGRCGGNNHIPYANVLLASLIDKNEDDLADSQLRVDDDTLQQIVQTEADQTQTKLDTINANISAQGEAIVNAINSLKTTLGTKLDALNTGIAGVDASVDEVTAAVNDVNEDTEAISTKVDTANTKLDTIATNTTPAATTEETDGGA